MEAAIEMIDAEGEAGVRVDVVADRAGIAKPSLYHFFGGRDGLVVAAQAERYRRSVLFGVESQTAAAQACRTTEDFHQHVRDWFTTVAMPGGVERRRIRVQVLGSSVSRPALREEIVRVDIEAAAAIAKILRYATDQGWLDIPYDFEVLSMWWYGMITGRFEVEVDRPGAALIQREWDTIATESVMRLLFGKPFDATPGDE